MARLELVSGLNGRSTVFSAIIFLILLVIRNHSFNFVFTSLYKLLPLHFFQQSLPGLNLIFFARLKTHLLNIYKCTSQIKVYFELSDGVQSTCALGVILKMIVIFLDTINVQARCFPDCRHSVVARVECTRARTN